MGSRRNLAGVARSVIVCQADDLAGVPVDDQAIPIGSVLQDPWQVHYGGESVPAGDDGPVRDGAAGLHDDRLDLEERRLQPGSVVLPASRVSGLLR
jgi:hypothetical protein